MIGSADGIPRECALKVRSRARRRFEALGAWVLTGVLLLGGCDDSGPVGAGEPAAEIPVPLPSGPDAMAQVVLEYDPATGTVHQTVVPVPRPARRSLGWDAGAPGGAAPVFSDIEENLFPYLSGSSTCDVCNNGVAGPHTITTKLTPSSRVLAKVRVEAPVCVTNCTVTGWSTLPGTLPEVMTADSTFTVEIGVDVGQAGRFRVVFNVFGKLLDVQIFLMAVSFTGDHTIDMDGRGPLVDPVWIDRTDDSVPEENEPVAYTGGTHMQMSAKFKVVVTPQLSNPLKADIRATGAPMSFAFENVDLPGAGGEVVYSASADTPLPPVASVLDQLQLGWSFNTRTRPALADGFANSSHLVYGTFRAPTTAPLYITILDYSTRRAAGKLNQDDVFNAIWAEFQDPVGSPIYRRVLNSNTGSVEQDLERPLTYWKTDAPLPCDATSTVQLLRDTNGQCHSWASHLQDALTTHGIGSVKVRILPPVPPQYGGGFLVKAWTFTARTGAECVDGFPFFKNEITDEEGIAGQGNDNPHSDFSQHFVVLYGARLYDPSYGSGPFADLAAWERASIDGYSVAVSATASCYRPDDPAVQETVEVLF